MKLIELEREVYDPAFNRSMVHDNFEYHDQKTLAKLLNCQSIEDDELIGLLLADVYSVSKSSTSDYCIIWKDWDEMSAPPVDLLKVAGTRRKVAWDHYEPVFDEAQNLLRIEEGKFSVQQDENWPWSGWEKYVQRSLKFPGVSLLIAHEHYGVLTGGGKKTHGGVYLPFRSVGIVTNYQNPLETPLV